MIRHVLIGLFAAIVAIVVVAVAQPEEPPTVALGPQVVKIDDLERFLPKPESLRRASATQPANPLSNIVKEAVFDGAPLNDVITFLRHATGANIDVNWYALRAEGVEPTTTVTLNLTSVPASVVLSRALENAAANHRIVKYRYDDHGIVRVTTAEYLAAETDIRLYNVRDLLINAMGFHRSFDHAVTRRDPPTRPSDSVTHTLPKPHEITWTEADLADNLTSCIRHLVDPDSWVDNGGRFGAAYYWAGKLLIVQTPENHEEIQRLLDMLREE